LNTKNLTQSDVFLDFKKSIKSAKRILLSTHALPDGDGLGAEYALYHYLKSAKKSCRVYNPDRLPKRYEIFDPQKKILCGPNEAEIWDQFDLWIIVDTHDPRRLGPLWGALTLRAKKIFFIDHHPEVSASDEFFYPPHCSSISDVTSSSIGEMLYNIFKELKLAKINKEIALGLYVSIMTDTNSFRYARTTPLSHKIAAETLSFGVNPEEVYQAIFSSKEVSHLQLLGSLLQKIKCIPSGKIAWMEMDLTLRKKHRASADDTLSFMNLLLLLKSAEIVCLFREEDEGSIRVSIRSKGKVPVNKVAAEFGGGGHDYAAGFSVESPLEKTIKAVTQRLSDTLEQFEKFGKI